MTLSGVEWVRAPSKVEGLVGYGPGEDMPQGSGREAKTVFDLGAVERERFPQ
jgi:hypothetical protein